MGPARIVILLVALIAAIGLAVVVRNMMSSREAPAPAAIAAPAPIPMARVLVAQTDLPIGTRLSPEHMGWQPFPVEGLNPNFITDGSAPAVPAQTLAEKASEGVQAVMQNMSGSAALDSLVGAIVREPVLAGEPIQARKLVRGGEGGYLAVVLNSGKRALGVPVTAESGAGGLILPGDRVDVIQSYETPGVDGQPPVRVTRPVVLNVRVLAIDQKTQPDAEANAMVGAVATLEVAPDAADALVEAIARGPMQLALRSYADTNAPSGRAGPGPSRAAAGGGSKVRIFSQSETSEVTVSR